MAASHSHDRTIRSPQRLMPLLRSVSPEACLLGQAKMSADQRGFGKAGRILDGGAERKGSDRTDAGNRHQQPADGIGLHRRQHHAVKLVETANRLLADREDGTNDQFENLIAINELANPLLQATSATALGRCFEEVGAES